MKPWVLDLCSGLGGASESFASDPYWTVYRVENNPALCHVPHTRILDILGWLDWLPDLISELGRPDLIIAAPPCREFSMGYLAPGPMSQRAGIQFEPNMALLEACIDIIEFCNPTFHIIENVQGAIPHFLVYLGHYRQRIGPFYFWGAFPQLNLPMNFQHRKSDVDVWSSDPLRANKKAMWPIEISRALKDAICEQSTLNEWI